MRAEVLTSMEQEHAGVIRDRVRGQLLDAIYRDNPIDLPLALVDGAQQLQVEAARRLGVREASRSPASRSRSEAPRGVLACCYRSWSRPRAERRTRAREQCAARWDGRRLPGIRTRRAARTSIPDAMRQIESAALEDQAVDWLLAHAQVTERPMTFADPARLRGQKRHARPRPRPRPRPCGARPFGTRARPRAARARPPAT